MLPRCLLPIVLACAAGLAQAAASAEPTSVALTMTKPAEASTDRPLAENLLELVELAIQADSSLAVVERRQIELAMAELILDRSGPGDPQLQLGKLITADSLVMLEILPADKELQKPWARLRVVDPKTASIRGATVASLDEATLEETAQQFSRYALATIQAPDKPTVTVAVLPFESKGRFDRLRPLELGIRDLVTGRLLELSGAVSPLPTENEKEKEKPAGQILSFQVLQRSNMEQLLRELDLIQSGLSDKSRLPGKLPPRTAAYLVRGEINERQLDDKYTIVVHGELVEAVAARVVDKFDFECPPLELGAKLNDQVDRFAQRLWKDEKIAQPRRVRATFEVQSLKQQTMEDLRRFRRIDPRTGHGPCFHFPKQHPYYDPRAVDARSLLGQHLLHKSIDRLESILYMTPDDAEAAYALGFCYSINEPDFYRPERADELFRKAAMLVPRGRLGELALHYLSQIDFDDRTGHLIPGHETQAIERAWFAFATMPSKFQAHTWMFIGLLGKLHQRPEQNQALADLVTKIAPFAENAKPHHRKMLASGVYDLAMQLIRQAHDQPGLQAKGLSLLNRWADGDDRELAYWGRKGLAALVADQQDFVAAAEACEASAALIVELRSSEDRDRHDGMLIEAAKLYRSGGDPARALKLLESFEVRFPSEKVTKPTNDLLGFQQYEIGRCQELLGHPEKALAAYLHATKINPTVARKSDIRRQIERLGGVPPDEDRDVDVKYFSYPPGDRQSRGLNMHLASDGHNLYVGGDQGVRAFNVANQSWEPTSFPPQAVTCIKGVDGQLFVGTKSDGLWLCDVSSGRWQRACPLDQLPDPHVESLTLDDHDIYLGVGTKASGGLVRIDGAGDVHVFNEPDAPAVAPTHIVVADHSVTVSTAESLYQWSLTDKAWSRKELPNHWPHRMPPQLFAGRTATWISGKGRELAMLQATDEENARFQPAWCIPANNTDNVVHNVQRGYAVNFLAQRGDEIWFGGDPWAPFVSSGLYRFRLKTGDFHKFTPADGFKATSLHFVLDGLWLDDHLWLTTNSGLCVVTPIKPPNAAVDSHPAD